MATTSSQLSIIIAALTDLANRVQAAAWAAHVIISSRLCDTDLSHGINPVMPPIFPIVGDDELKVLSSLYANALLPRETARIDGKILKGMHEFEQRVDYANACRIRDRAAVAYGVLVEAPLCRIRQASVLTGLFGQPAPFLGRPR